MGIYSTEPSETCVLHLVTQTPRGKLFEIAQPRGWAWERLEQQDMKTNQVLGTSFHASLDKLLTIYYQDGIGTIRIATAKQPWFERTVRENDYCSEDTPREYMDLKPQIKKWDGPGNLFAFLGQEDPNIAPNIFFRAHDNKIYYRQIRKSNDVGNTTWEDVEVCTAKKGTHFTAAEYPSWRERKTVGRHRLPTLIYIAPDGSMRQVQVSTNPLHMGVINEREVFGSNCAAGSLSDIYGIGTAKV